MKNGWGYGHNYSLLDSNKLHKSFESEDIKVYKANIIYNGYLNIKYIINKKTKEKYIYLKLENRKMIRYPANKCKNKSDIVEFICHELLAKYTNEVC